MGIMMCLDLEQIGAGWERYRLARSPGCLANHTDLDLDLELDLDLALLSLLLLSCPCLRV